MNLEFLLCSDGKQTSVEITRYYYFFMFKKAQCSIFNTIFFTRFFNTIYHSHKKRKDSLEGSLKRVLFGAELEFPKIQVPMIHQNTSNVNIECARKSKQLYSLLWPASCSTDIYSFHCSNINLFLIDYER